MRTEDDIRSMLKIERKDLAKALSTRKYGYDELNERLILYKQNAISWLEWVLEEEE